MDWTSPADVPHAAGVGGAGRALVEAGTMYVLVQHYVSDVQTFWSAVRHGVHLLPPNLVLHHCLPTPDGSHAVCVWEAEGIRDVKAFLETYVGHASRNLYFPVEAAGGIGYPSGVALADGAAKSME